MNINLAIQYIHKQMSTIPNTCGNMLLGLSVHGHTINTLNIMFPSEIQSQYYIQTEILRLNRQWSNIENNCDLLNHILAVKMLE